jgi:glycosyltransferase involved in cell wall biosynthesis
MNLVFVGHRCCDHSPSSGYDQVCALFPESGWLDGRALEIGRVEWIREPAGDVSAELRVFHVFYGDCSGKRLPAMLRSRFPEAAIVSSVHQPVDRMRADETAWAAVAESDAIITVAKQQAHDLSTFGLSAPVYAIAHGVWTKVFRPSAPSADGKYVLLVGSYLRDWAAAKYVIGELARAGVRCVALGAAARDQLAGENVPVEGLRRVAEQELVTLYHGAAAVFLPFLEATASNALLEAMAAGCPVVCPNLPSLVTEYLGDDIDAFPVGSLDIAVRRLVHYVGNAADRAARSHVLMTRAQRFDWASLEPLYRTVYSRAAITARTAIRR